ncbi:MAG: hypothetical protein ACI4TS_01000 [Bacteroidaceae bacterium]
MKNKDGVNICYNIVSSELYNRKVEVAKSDERYEKPIVIPSMVNSDFDGVIQFITPSGKRVFRNVKEHWFVPATDEKMYRIDND